MPLVLTADTTPLQLDFGRDLFPVLLLEMAMVWYGTQLDQRTMSGFHEAVCSPFEAFVRHPPVDRDRGIELLLAPVERWIEQLVLDGLTPIQVETFDWRALFNPLADEDEHWGERLTAFLHRDLAAATRGNLSDPGKACSDAVWRDLRGVLGTALDRGGLTARSQREWRQVYGRYYCRMANGPGIPSQAKLLALIEAGLVDPASGPQTKIEPCEGGFQILGEHSGEARSIPALISARTHDFDIDADRSPLYRNLHDAGLVRLWVNPDAEEILIPGCLDLDADFHPIRRDGQSEARLTVLGAPAEGLVHFHLSAARPQSGSSLFATLDRWARGALTLAHVEQSERVIDVTR